MVYSGSSLASGDEACGTVGFDRYDEPFPVYHRIEQHDMGVIAQLRLPDIFLHY